jgi:hypothetical protein
LIQQSIAMATAADSLEDTMSTQSFNALPIATNTKTVIPALKLPVNDSYKKIDSTVDPIVSADTALPYSGAASGGTGGHRPSSYGFESKAGGEGSGKSPLLIADANAGAVVTVAGIFDHPSSPNSLIFHLRVPASRGLALKAGAGGGGGGLEATNQGEGLSARVDTPAFAPASSCGTTSLSTKEPRDRASLNIETVKATFGSTANHGADPPSYSSYPNPNPDADADSLAVVQQQEQEHQWEVELEFEFDLLQDDALSIVEEMKDCDDLASVAVDSARIMEVRNT